MKNEIRNGLFWNYNETTGYWELAFFFLDCAVDIYTEILLEDSDYGQVPIGTMIDLYIQRLVELHNNKNFLPLLAQYPN